MRPDKKKKLVILGGGIGSLVTAWHLTSQPNWKEIYESITVYQTGWRLGGKCASGRGPNAFMTLLFGASIGNFATMRVLPLRQ